MNETHRHIFFQKTSVRFSHLTEHTRKKTKTKTKERRVLLTTFCYVIT